jgi:MarR family transcriptional regulator, organic hydroperoxide resistance regulator
MSTLDIERIQRAYPKIYLACHTRHVRARSTAYRLSSRDAAVLAHLGVRASTLSAAIQKLELLGYLKRTQSAADRRVASLFLTPQGARAMAATSVLDSRQVAALLAQLKPREKARAIEGLELLACGSMRVMSMNRKRGRSNA